jgi:SAM-dependent methyltransferase
MSSGARPGPGIAATAPEPYARPDLYDLLFEGIEFDLAFYRELASAAQGPVLDLACGTGRVLLPLLEAGVEIEGVDASARMLERLREKARARGLAPRVHQASMSAFDLGRRFRVVMIPFNSFVHNLTPDDQIATLRRCHEHLEPGGVLAFDFFAATPTMLAVPHGSRVLEHEAPHPETGLPVRVWDARDLDVVTQTQHSRIEIEELGESGGVAKTHRFETRVRWVQPAEMELLLRLAGFAHRALWGDFARGPLTAGTAHVVAEAWRD